MGYREPLTSGGVRFDTPTMTQAPTVVLAGRGLHTLLSEVDVTVLAMVDSGPEAEHAARAQLPDVVVLDLRACANACDALIRRLRETGCAVLVFNTSADEAALVTAIRAGARGFVTGEVTARQLAHTIRVLAGGSALFGADVAGPLLSRLCGRTLPPDLTDREREVLDLVNAGHTHRAIAAKLALAPKTIRNTVASINAKQRAAKGRPYSPPPPPNPPGDQGLRAEENTRPETPERKTIQSQARGPRSTAASGPPQSPA